MKTIEEIAKELDKQSISFGEWIYEFVFKEFGSVNLHKDYKGYTEHEAIYDSGYESGRHDAYNRVLCMLQLGNLK